MSQHLVYECDGCGGMSDKYGAFWITAHVVVPVPNADQIWQTRIEKLDICSKECLGDALSKCKGLISLEAFRLQAP